MSGAGDQRPDRGVPDQCADAARDVGRYAEALAQAGAAVSDQVVRVTDAVWAGQGAQAFGSRVAEVGVQAEEVVEAWDRLKEAIWRYSTGLAGLQDEGDRLRRRLSDAEDELAQVQQRVTWAGEDVLAGDAFAAGQIGVLNTQVVELQEEIDRYWRDLANLAEDRRDLDDVAVEALRDAPGPGARVWAAVAYRANGAVRPVQEVVVQVVDRLSDGRITEEDLELLGQVVSQYSSDAGVMDELFEHLGASGTVEVMDAVLGTTGSCPDWTATRLAAGLACASGGWDADAQRGFGRDLIEALGDPDVSIAGQRRSAVGPALLSAQGLAPLVAAGALSRLDELRTQDPDRFEHLMHPDTTAIGDPRAVRSGVDLLGDLDRVLGADRPDLSRAVFTQLAQVPSEALGFFTQDPARVGYWFEQHDWSAGGFTGPAALLDAIVNSTDARTAHAADPAGPQWARIVGFVSHAFEHLGANPDLQVGQVSAAASLDLAEALGAFVPETAAGLGAAGGTVSVLSPDGTMITVPALSTHRGNLARLLGTALVDPDALAVYLTSTTHYTTRVVDHLTGPGHPSLYDARALAGQVGGLHGLVFGSYSLQAELHAEQISENTRRDLDTLMGLAGLIPGVETGSQGLDWAAGALAGVAGDAAVDSWPGIATRAELDALIAAGLDEGTVAMGGITDTITGRWDAIERAYEDENGESSGPEALTGQLALDYSNAASAYSNPTPADEQKVRVMGDDAPGGSSLRTLREMS